MEPDVERRLISIEARLANVESVRVDDSAELKTLQSYLQAFRREWKLESDVKHEETHARLATIEAQLNRIEVIIRLFNSRADIGDTRMINLETKMDGHDAKLREIKSLLDEVLTRLTPKE
jgi:capsule polysaccharide export protein KpsE/RkpR